MTTDKAERSSILRSSAVMAAGTIVSRISGMLRGILLVAALGSGLHADLFNIANTVPNMLYILLAGGVFNAVLVPQLVRTMKNDADGGAAYVDRIITLAMTFLLAVTVLLVIGAPWVMQIFMDHTLQDPALAPQRDSLTAFARFCLPQVFFYGMYVLVGQVLNARGSFGPMMWAPIANNVISVLVLVGYLLVWGSASADAQCGPFTGPQELWLGLGSTLGIAAQLLILLPYLRAAGVRYRPRFDFQGTGLGTTMRLAVWTVLFVIVNQIAYVVVVRLASGGTASQALSCGGGGAEAATGYTVYSTAFLIVMVPHSIITVSLATAVLPTLSARAADGDLPGLARSLGSTMRTSLAVMLPFAALMPIVAGDISRVLFGHGANSDGWSLYALTLGLFGLGILFFTLHYLVLRGFYAIEENRTVFLIQCVVAAVNIIAAVLLVGATDALHTSPALVGAYTVAYAVGSLLSIQVLRRRLGTIDGARLVRFVVRTVIAMTPGMLLAWGASALLHRLLPGSFWTSVIALVVAGVVALGVYVALAPRFRLTEITDVTGLVARRVRRRAES